jgi:pimeloyl-ACP methyl ester carboxylesterase
MEPRHTPNGSPARLKRIPVTLEVRPFEDRDTVWHVSGDLHLPAGTSPRSVQVLVPGLTYDRRYWTLPGRYDFAEYMGRAGYAVLAFDRIGTGTSSRPPAAEVTAEAHVAVLHRLIQSLRSGELTGLSFDRVVVVGHSYGSGIAIMEAARHQDVDGLIVSGMLHAFTELYKEVIDFFHPASQDPVVGPTAPPAGYLTQRPGYRVRMLEHTPGIEPEMSEYNEQIKSTGALGEGDTLPQTYLPSHSLAVRVPVLIAVGQYDALFCGEAVGFGQDMASVHAYESAFYSPEARLETRVIPGAGHSLNLHRNAETWFGIALDWVDREVTGVDRLDGTDRPDGEGRPGSEGRPA